MSNNNPTPINTIPPDMVAFLQQYAYQVKSVDSDDNGPAYGLHDFAIQLYEDYASSPNPKQQHLKTAEYPILLVELVRIALTFSPKEDNSPPTWEELMEGIDGYSVQWMVQQGNYVAIYGSVGG